MQHSGASDVDLKNYLVQLHEKTAQLEKLKKEILEQDREIEQLRNQNTSYNSEVDYKGDGESLEVERLKRLLRIKEEECDSHSSEMAKMRQALVTQHNQSSELNTVKGEEKGDADSDKAKAADIEKLRDELRQKVIGEYTAELERLRDRQADFDKQKYDLGIKKSECDALNSYITKLRQEKNEMENLNQQLSSEIERLKKCLGESNEELEKEGTGLKEVDSSVNQLTNEIGDLQKRLVAKTTEYDELVLQHTVCKERTTETARSNEELSKEVEDLKRMYELKKAECEELNSYIAKQRQEKSENEDIKLELAEGGNASNEETPSKENKENESSKVQFANEIHNLKNSLESKAAAYQSLEASLELKTTECKDMESLKNRLQDEVNSLKKSLEIKAGECKEIEISKNRLQDEVNSLEKSLETTTAEWNKLKQEVAICKERNEKVESASQEVNMEIENLRRILEVKKSECEEHSTEIAALRQTLAKQQEFRAPQNGAFPSVTQSSSVEQQHAAVTPNEPSLESTTGIAQASSVEQQNLATMSSVTQPLLDSTPSVTQPSLASTPCVTQTAIVSTPSVTQPALVSTPSVVQPLAISTPNVTQPPLTSTPSVTQPSLASTPSVNQPAIVSTLSVTQPSVVSTPGVTQPSFTSTPSITQPSLASTPSVNQPAIVSTPSVTQPSVISMPGVTQPSLTSTPSVTQPSLASTPSVTQS